MVPVPTAGSVSGGEVLGKAGRLVVVVVGGCLSTVTACVVAVALSVATGAVVVASVVSLVGCTRAELHLVVGCSVEPLVVVGCRESASEVAMTEGGLLVLTAELGAWLVCTVVVMKLVDGASVTLAVNGGSTTSWLTVGGVGAVDVLDTSGAEEVVTSGIDSSVACVMPRMVVG